jgi:hypothetical protein
MTPEEARSAVKEILKAGGIPEGMTMLQYGKLKLLAAADMPLIQLWVRASGFTAAMGWTPARWKKFHAELPGAAKIVKASLFRGTKLPLIGGGHLKDSSPLAIDRTVKKAISDFDAQKPHRVTRTMSWTTSRKIAETFAKAKHLPQPGQAPESMYSLGSGFVHVLLGGGVGVDVLDAVRRASLVKTDDGNDELKVARREKEVLLPVGTVLVPVSRQGRVFQWRM